MEDEYNYLFMGIKHVLWENLGIKKWPKRCFLSSNKDINSFIYHKSEDIDQTILYTPFEENGLHWNINFSVSNTLKNNNVKVPRPWNGKLR